MKNFNLKIKIFTIGFFSGITTLTVIYLVFPKIFKKYEEKNNNIFLKRTLIEIFFELILTSLQIFNFVESLEQDDYDWPNHPHHEKMKELLKNNEKIRDKIVSDKNPMRKIEGNISDQEYKEFLLKFQEREYTYLLKQREIDQLYILAIYSLPNIIFSVVSYQISRFFQMKFLIRHVFTMFNLCSMSQLMFTIKRKHNEVFKPGNLRSTVEDAIIVKLLISVYLVNEYFIGEILDLFFLR